MPDIRLSLDQKTLEAIDEVRGPIPRVRWIRTAVQERLDGARPDTPETVAEKLKPVRAIKKALAPDGVDIVDLAGHVVQTAQTGVSKRKTLENHHFVGIGKRCGACHGPREDHPV